MTGRFTAVLAVGLALGFATVTGAAAVVAAPTATATGTMAQTLDDGTTIDTGNGTLVLEAAPNQTVGGESDLEPGTELTLRLRSTAGSMPFLRTADATVREDGTWTATVDLSSVADQPRFTAVVIHDGDRLANTTGRVVGEPTDPLDDVDPAESENYTLVATSDDSPPPANASFDPENGSLQLVNGTAQRVSGTTDLAAGSRVTVRLEGTGTSPVLRTTRTVVTGNGTFGAAFDLSNVPANTSFEARVRYDGERIANRSGVVAECQQNCSVPTDEWLTDAVALARQDESETMTVNLVDGAEAATLTVGSAETNYRLEASLRDTDDDGLVTVAFDPAAAGAEAPTLTAEGDDEATIKVEAALAPPLDPANYDVTLYRGDDIDDRPVDIGTLVVTEAADGADESDG